MKQYVVLASLFVMLLLGWLIYQSQFANQAIPIPLVESIDGIDPEIVTAIETLVAKCRASNRFDHHYFDLAKTYQANGFDLLASECYAHYLGDKPKLTQGWFFKSLCHSKLGEVEAAAQCLEECIKLKSTFPAVFWRLALLKSDLNDYESALKLLDRAEALDAKDVNVALIKAKVLIAKNENDAAIQLLDKHDFSQQPNEAYARFLKGSALRQLGDVEGSTQWLADTGDARPQWSDRWSDELRVLETGVSGQRIRASELFKNGQFSQAKQLLETIVLSPKADHRDWGILSECYLRLNNAKRAIECATQATVVGPNDYNSWMKLAKLQFAAAPSLGPESLDLATSALNKAVLLRPDDWEPEDGLGQILQVRGQKDQAIEKYRAACKKARQVSLCHWRLAFLLVEQKQWDELAALLDQIESSQKDEPMFLVIKGFLALGRNDLQTAKASLDAVQEENIKDRVLLAKYQQLRGEIRSAQNQK